MKIVIDISEEYYNRIKKEYKHDFKLYEIVANGTPLEKVFEDIKAEMKSIHKLEQQIYGKECWNFTVRCMEIIDKHISGKER